MMSNKYLLLFASVALIGSTAVAQTVGISSSAFTPNSASILDISSTTKGVLLPRMTTAERGTYTTTSSLGATHKGITIFNTTTNRYDYWDGTAWLQLAAVGAAGSDFIQNQTAASQTANYRISGVGIHGNGTAGAPTLTFEGSQTTGLFRPAADQIGFSTAATQRAVIDATGNLGIGTASPTQPLTVYQAGTARISVRGASTFHVIGNDATNGPYISWVNTQPLRFSTATDDGGTGWTERMRLTPGGSLGIGNNNPAHMLDVAGSIQADIASGGYLYGRLRFTDTRLSDYAPTTYDHELRTEFKERGVVGAPGTASYGGMMTIAPWFDNSGGNHTQLFFSNDGIFTRQGSPDAATWNAWSQIVTSTSGNNGYIQNQNASAQTTGNFWISGTGRTNGTLTGGGSTVISADNIQVNDLGAGARYAYIDLEGDDTYTDYGLRLIRGNGGVNATSTLTHRGTGDLQIHTNEAAALTFHTTNAERMRIQAGGNVGVNSNAPSNRLYVNDVAATMGTVNTYQFGIGLSAATNLTLGADASFGLMQTWSSKPLLINSQGNNVGIGMTTAPTARLDVQFAAADRAVRIRNTNNAASSNGLLVSTTRTATDAYILNLDANGASRMYVRSDGNVGIGTTTPAALLAVGGAGANVYNTSAWIENNIHVQGNETLNQGGRGRLRVGTVWGYVGLYTDGSSTGQNNDLVLGASSALVRVGPTGGGQNLRVSGLQGTGNRAVYADANGTLFTIPDNSNWTMAAHMQFSDDDIGFGWTSSVDDGYFSANMGWTVRINGVDYSDLTLNTNGTIVLGSQTAYMGIWYGFLPTASVNLPMIAWYARDMVTRYRYGSVGTSPNRVYIIDFDSNAYGTGDDVDGQVQIHENSGLINVFYRVMDPPVNGQNGTIGFQINSSKGYPLTYFGKVADDNRLPQSWSVSPVR